MPTSTTETIVLSTVQRNQLVARQGAQSGLLIAPMPTSLPLGSTVVPNVVYEYNDEQTAIADWGAGSLLAVGVAAALFHLEKVKVIGVGEKPGSPFTETRGDTAAVNDSGDVGSGGPLTVTSLPVGTVTGVVVDATTVSADDIIITGENPLTLTLTADQVAINPKTGAWKLGTSTSGSGLGFRPTFTAYDWDAAFEEAVKSTFEYIAIPGTPLSGATYGEWANLVDFATLERKNVATALASGAIPEVRDPTGNLSPTIRSIRNGRLKILAWKDYEGDLVSAFMAATAAMVPDGSSKEQPAPLGITGHDGYSFSEFGGEAEPSVGTWHEIGVNAVYLAPGGQYLITNDRASTALTDFERFHSTRRVIRIIENEVQEDLLALRRASPVSLPYDETGLNAIRGTIRSTLARMVDRGFIRGHTIFVPSIDATTANDRQLRVLRGVVFGILLRGQIHMIEITMEVSI